MYLLRVTHNGTNAFHLLYKTEKGALKAIERYKEQDPDVKIIMFEEVSQRYRQERLPF